MSDDLNAPEKNPRPSDEYASSGIRVSRYHARADSIAVPVAVTQSPPQGSRTCSASP